MESTRPPSFWLGGRLYNCGFICSSDLTSVKTIKDAGGNKYIHRLRLLRKGDKWRKVEIEATQIDVVNNLDDH